MNTLFDLLEMLLDLLGLVNRRSNTTSTRSQQELAEYEQVERDYEYDEQ